MRKDQPRSKAWESTVRKTQLQRRGCNAMSVAPYDPDADPPSTPVHVERLLSNGDFYMGRWAGDRPHGPGKYLWTDGCMYEGEWRHGKTMGKGKFSWPSGATYEGDFSSGYLNGFGTFTGASGDTYRGHYNMNLKHGHGRRTYTNGDYYDGEWRAGVQEGPGRYIWKSGHDYNGQWKAGVIHGKGTLVWANGNSYDGEWEDGRPSGKGQFRWADGGLYVGTWSREQTGKKGVYFPSAASANPSDAPRDPQEEMENDLMECRVCPGENLSVLPSQKKLHWSSGDSERRRGSEGGRRSSYGGSSEKACTSESEDELADGRGEGMQTPERPSGMRAEDAGRLPVRWVPLELKKQGEVICKGHKNYELMLNLQLGIRHSVGRPAPATSLDLKASCFDPKEKVWTRFPPEGSKNTPPHQSCEFKWKDYCPVVFRTLRKLFKVDAADYMISICGNNALRELSSPGKSGSFFYLTHDDRYMIKTMKKSEVKVLLRMLPAYYNHVRSYEHTLVTKFFGLHCVKLTGAAQKKVRFVIMGNLFCSEFVIHRRFDLKGSSHGRTTDKSEAEIDETTTLKDLDLNFIFRLQKSWFQEFVRQVDKDCELLELERIMDYSLLVGLHFKEASTKDGLPSEGGGELTKSIDSTLRVSRTDMDQLLSDPNRLGSIKLGINMTARVEQTVRRSDCDSQLIGEPTGELYDVVLFFGIIDILQDYDISKKLEHAYKSFQYDPTSISAVDPRQYARRFRDFVFRVFIEDS